MIQSMTGFYSGEASWKLQSGETLRLGFEIKSLNSRFFELGTRLPSALLSQENLFTNIFKQKLCRGKALLSLKVLSDAASLERIAINVPLIKSYLNAAEKLRQLTGSAPEFKTVDWLTLPRIISFENDLFTEKDLQSLAEFCAQWAEGLLQDRLREGSLIGKDLEKSIEKIAQLEEKIFHENTAQQEELRHKLEKQRGHWESSREAEQHVAQQEHKKFTELEALLEKSDIHEEVMRSNMHLASIRQMIQAPSYEVGKKLEFTLQELLRETNTISSKIANYEINSSCVNIKFELDKLREQAQNIV